jgi:hypothetical protein
MAPNLSPNRTQPHAAGPVTSKVRRNSKMSIPIFGLLALMALSHGIQFPGSVPSVSPNGRFVLTWKEPSKGIPDHQLFLRDRKFNWDKSVYQFGRHIEVVWAPDSKHFALTDHAGSNLSEVLLVDPLNSGQKLSVPIPEEIEKKIADHHHVYIQFVRWLSGRKVRLSIEAYDSNSKSPYKGYFDYELQEK